MWDEIAPDEQAARTRQQLAMPVQLAQPKAGVFNNVVSGTGSYFMRSMAEAGRGLSMAAAVVPIVADKLTAGDNMSGESLTDSYFKWHDEMFNRAVDHWTPKPGEVGAAGEVLGGLGGGIVQFLANPALALNTAQMSTSEDLVRQGVDAKAAVGAGTIAAAGTAVGMKVPVAGKNLAQRVASGVAGNVAQSVVVAGSTQALLKGSGAPDQVAEQFNPWDLKGWTIDALLGAAFGVKEHMGVMADAPMTQAQKDALLLLNQARHMDDIATPNRPAAPEDLNRGVTAVRTAIDQMLRGEPVAVEGLAPKISPRPLATETPEFKAWFGDSKVVGADGKPLVVYHGTSADVSAFDLSKSGAFGENFGRVAFFSSDPAVAGSYAARWMGSADFVAAKAAHEYALSEYAQAVLRNGKNAPESQAAKQAADAAGNVAKAAANAVERMAAPSDGANLIPAHLSMRNPLEVDAHGKSWASVNEQAINAAIDGGHDGVIIRNVVDSANTTARQAATVYAVFDPKQIKSAIGNSGAFDPSSPSLTDSRFANWADQIRAAVDEMRRDTIQPPKMEAADIKPTADGAAPRPQFADDVKLPTGEFDPKTGAPVAVSANDYIARAHAELADVKARGVELMRVAAGCLLGGI